MPYHIDEMFRYPIIKRWGVAVVATLLEILKLLSLWIGSKPAGDIDSSLSPHRNSKIQRKRFSLAEILEGVTQENIKALEHETTWALQATPVGEELT